MNKNSIKNIILVVLSLLCVFFLFVTYTIYSKLNAYERNPQKLAQSEAALLINQVKALMVLPENEMPVIATIANPDLLKNQPFFANAKKGHRLLLYPNNRKAILFDQENNKIVEAASLNIGAGQPSGN